MDGRCGGENAFFAPFIHLDKQHRAFAKTGSGQTQGNAERRGGFCRGLTTSRRTPARRLVRLPGPFLFVYPKRSVLPRQARDKHRKKLRAKKGWRILQAAPSTRTTTPGHLSSEACSEECLRHIISEIQTGWSPRSERCPFDSALKRLDPNETLGWSRYATMRDVLNKTGRPVFFSLCGWEPWYAAPDAALGYEGGASLGTANCIIIGHFSAFEPGLVAPFLYAA